MGIKAHTSHVKCFQKLRGTHQCACHQDRNHNSGTWLQIKFLSIKVLSGLKNIKSQSVCKLLSQSVCKLLKMSHSISFQKVTKLNIFGIFNELFIRFARNVEWDFFCDLQTLWKYYLFERLCATFFRRFECWFEIIGRRLIFGILSVPFCAVRQGTCKSMDQNEWLLSRTLLSSWLALQLFMCTQNYNLEFIIIYCFKSV